MDDPDLLKKILPPVNPAASLTQHEETFLERLESYPRFVIFSPHLDDAILSMGSLLAHLGTYKKPIDIVTVFTDGSPVASDFNKKLLRQGGVNGPQEYFLKRRSEDYKAFSEFKNISITHLGLTDAAWRHIGEGEPLYPTTALGKIHEKDTAPQALFEKLAELSQVIKGAAIFAPLARGKHVDHQIVRNAVSSAFFDTIHYCDFPYSTHHEDEHEFIKTHSLTKAEWYRGDYEKKRQAIATYKSQAVSLIKSDKLQLSYETYYFTS